MYWVLLLTLTTKLNNDVTLSIKYSDAKYINLKYMHGQHN